MHMYVDGSFTNRTRNNLHMSILHIYVHTQLKDELLNSNADETKIPRS
jgi:hypothetical protein